MNYRIFCILFCLSSTTVGCATVEHRDIPVGFNLLRLQDREIVATYREGPTVVWMEIEIGTNEINLTTSDERHARLLKFTVPLDPTSRLEPSRGYFSLEPTFKARTPSRQVSLLLMHSKLSEALLKSAVADIPEPVQAMVKATPVMINISLERSGSGRDPAPPIWVSWFSESDDCFGACGAGCGPFSLCSCMQGRCLCLTNGFCQWHDRCCGAFSEILNCRPGCVPTQFEADNWL